MNTIGRATKVGNDDSQLKNGRQRHIGLAENFQLNAHPHWLDQVASVFSCLFDQQNEVFPRP